MSALVRAGIKFSSRLTCAKNDAHGDSFIVGGFVPIRRLNADDLKEACDNLFDSARQKVGMKAAQSGSWLSRVTLRGETRRDENGEKWGA
jgi:hypothetical protein